MDLEDKGYYRYAADVLEGRIVTGDYVKMACRRFMADLDRADLEFRRKNADLGIEFISYLRHFRGSASGKPFRLEGWQEFIVANLLGWYRPDGLRRFTSAYIEVSRKNGKTALMSALALYFLIADGEAGAEVDLAANSREQANIAYEFCRKFSLGLDPKGKSLDILRNTIRHEKTSSSIKVFAADTTKLDGFNASVGLIDEYHSAKSTAVRDVIKSSMGMRRNPMLLTITSAGFDKTLPCYQLRTVCTEILSGLKEDDSMFSMIFSLDDGDDWRNPAVWRKANPNLGVTVIEKNLEEHVKSAVNNPSEEASVRTKNLGQWLTTQEVWIPERLIGKNSINVRFEDFEGCDCWVGVDLASNYDMTALSFLLKDPDEETLFFKNLYYLPEEALQTGAAKDKYALWKREGHLFITPGNATDYQYITNDLFRLNETLNIVGIFYDPWNAVSWATQCTELGLPLEQFAQSLGNFNKPTREFERLIAMDAVKIDNNPITRWMFSNVSLKTDHNGNAKPNKGAGFAKKIDGVIAMLEALGGYLDPDNQSLDISIR